jgi:hypothetical protein
MSIGEVFKRANSHFKFHRYRKEIGNPVSPWHTARAWIGRIWFEFTRNYL